MFLELGLQHTCFPNYFIGVGVIHHYQLPGIDTSNSSLSSQVVVVVILLAVVQGTTY